MKREKKKIVEFSFWFLSGVFVNEIWLQQKKMGRLKNLLSQKGVRGFGQCAGRRKGTNVCGAKEKKRRRFILERFGERA